MIAFNDDLQTMTEPLQKTVVVAIDDDPLILELLKDALNSESVEVMVSSEAEHGLVQIREHRPSIVLLDLNLPDVHGFDLLPKILQLDPAISVVLLTADHSTENAVKAISMGATDYLTKPVPMDRLRTIVQAQVDRTQSHSGDLQIEKHGSASNFYGIIGRSPVMLELFSEVQRIAPHFKTAVVLGPTGTGKELIARALHQASPAARQPFVVINCAALSESLIESELFGHTKGAFTGAVADRAGMFETGNGGTVFLDEIGELPLAAQAKLLRVLQNSEIQRLGSSVPRRIDIRVIAATNRNLREMVSLKNFREDLYYRLTMVELTVPPLDERREDLPLLQQHFVKSFAVQYQKAITGLTRRAQNVLSRHPWYGNVRELENVIGRACMVARTEFVDVNDLPGYLLGTGSSISTPSQMSLAEVEKQHIAAVLKQCRGNKAAAAEVLGISRTSIYRIMSRTRSRQEVA